MDISKTELEVMGAIWLGHPATAQQVIERLNQIKPWHEKTVKTLLGRLVKKGALSFEQEGRRYLYTPMISQKDYQEVASDSLVSRFFKGKITPLVAAFADRGKLSEQDISELKSLIETLEQKHRD